MGHITILPTGACQADYLSNHLPTRYMEDFTLLGFTVSTFSRALELLDNAGYIIIRQDGGAQVKIASAEELRNIQTLFLTNNLSYEYGDLANTIYQA